MSDRETDYYSYIAIAQAAMARGVDRDDVYRETMQFAARNTFDRYDLWQEIVG